MDFEWRGKTQSELEAPATLLLGLARPAAAVAVIGDEAEGVVEGAVAAKIRMSADAVGEESEFGGEAAVGLITGVAEGAQSGFRG